MSEEVRILIESLRRGQYEDPSEKIALLGAALRESNADLSLLLSLVRAQQVPLRLAALDACGGRDEPELVDELFKLADDPDVRVRRKLAELLGTVKNGSNRLRILIQDANPGVRIAALKSTAGRREFSSAQQNILKNDSEWQVRLAAASALGKQAGSEGIKALFQALSDADDDVGRRCAEIIERRLVASVPDLEKQLPPEIALLARAERELVALGADRFPKLFEWIRAKTNVTVDPQALQRFGTDLTALAEVGALPRAYGVTEHCQTILKLLEREPRRSIALLGPAGSGKSALVSELVYELAKPENGKWRVLRVSPNDFMAGTRYLGEWETRVRDLIESVKKPRRVVIYVPNLSELATTGLTSRSDSNVATALAPYLEEGSVVVIGESTPEEFERGLGAVASLQRLFDRVLLPEASPETTRQILTAVRDEEKMSLSDAVLDQLLEVSGQFLSHISRPGNAVLLLRAMTKPAESGRSVSFRDVLESLSKSTGIPVDLLDDAVAVDATEVKAFFEKKIIGQSEAVEAVVDLVTLIKSGLTDPEKPFGVFLFVGPTGVGKTELARALAEFIFGDVTRLKRFDMSEFAGNDGFQRLLGDSSRTGLLTDAVRQHPFSVILLDEIEKSHVNVFDLCLQIFDAGRLTDGRGRTVDFRRTIVILTSNIGATGPVTPLGFGGTGSGPSVMDKDRMWRELSRFFRPEFLNRLDRIVQFRPLSIEVAEQIARREIDLVLQRTGIRRRELTIDIDPLAISLLVREGYSPHFGARPLKRTIERLLLLPLGRAISSGSIQGRTIIHVKQQDGRLRIMVSRPASPVIEQSLPPKERPRVRGLRAEVVMLQSRFAASETRVRAFMERKTELLRQAQRPGFYQDVALRTTTFDEIHKLDQFVGLWDGFRKAMEGVHRRLEGRPVTVAEGTTLTKRLEQLSSELDQLELIAQSKEANDLGDALVCLSLLERTGKKQGGVQKLADLYRSLATRRRMTPEILGEYFDEKHDRVYLGVAGLGAYAVLKDEAGLHQFNHRVRSKNSRNNREVAHHARESIRVEVLPFSTEAENPFRAEVKAKTTSLRPVRKRLLESDVAVSLFHEPTLRSLEIWTAGPVKAGVEKAIAVFHAQATSQSTAEGRSDGIVRQYDFGISPRVRDARSGRSTTRVDRVLKGELDSLQATSA